ncbi:MAG: N-acetyltransferase [Alteraurantiacibacter sp.]
MSQADATIMPLEAVAPEMIEALLDRAFGTDRHSRTAYKVREGVDWLPALSFAATDEADMLTGTIQCWPVALTDDDSRRHPMLMVGPVAVVPERQGEGFGHALMAALTGALDPNTPLPQVMVGDPGYYTRFGYSAAPTQRWDLPGRFERHRLLVRAANPAVLPAKGTLGPWIG